MRRIVLLFAVLGCSDVGSTTATSEVAGAGGALAETGGAESTGGAMATGGAEVQVQTGGVSTGGTVVATGGAQVATGGAVSSGGALVATGGASSATGGASTGGRATGGAATGGTPATGGAPHRCPVGIDETVGDNFSVDANGQCYSRVGVVSVPLVVPYTGRGTLKGYQNALPEALSDAVNEPVSSDCVTKVVVIGSGKVFWCGTRLWTNPWRCPAGWENLPKLTEEFWILSYEHSWGSSCGSPCNADMLGRLITDTTS